MKKKIFAVALVALMAVPALASTASACSRGYDIPGNITYQHSGGRNCVVTAWKEYRCSACSARTVEYFGVQYYHSH